MVLNNEVYQCFRSHTTLVNYLLSKDSCKVQNRLMVFNVTEYKEFIGRVSDSTLHVTFKKLPSVEFFFKFFNYYFKIYLFLAVLGLRCCARAFSSCSSGGYSSLQCTDFSLRWLLLLRGTGCRHVGFSSCSMWAQ